MNRSERRTRGKYIVERLNLIKNSSLFKEADLKDIPKDVIDTLVANTCENKELQRKYNSIKRLLSEGIELEIELRNMQIDLTNKQANKEKKGGVNSPLLVLPH